MGLYYIDAQPIYALLHEAKSHVFETSGKQPNQLIMSSATCYALFGQPQMITVYTLDGLTIHIDNECPFGMMYLNSEGETWKVRK